MGELDAAQLRAMGIGHLLEVSDTDLVATVEFLLELGIELADMSGEDLTYLAGPRIIRPDAVIGLDEAFDAGHDAAFRQRTALALGFNVTNTGGRLTPGEVDAINFFQSLRPLLGDEDLLALLRVMGNSQARIARSVLSALRVHFETPVQEATGSIAEVARAYQALTVDMLPPLLDATTTILRRHLSIGAGRPTIWTVDESRVATTELVTVGFVDLVGFTAFTEQADLKGFVEALSAFESRTQSIIVANGGTLVKLIGDEVMFVAPTQASGIGIARRLAAHRSPTRARRRCGSPWRAARSWRSEATTTAPLSTSRRDRWPRRTRTRSW